MTAKALVSAARSSKQVNGLPWGRSPAAFVCAMQFSFVMGYLPKLRIYKPKKAK